MDGEEVWLWKGHTRNPCVVEMFRRPHYVRVNALVRVYSVVLQNDRIHQEKLVKDTAIHTYYLL